MLLWVTSTATVSLTWQWRMEAAGGLGGFAEVADDPVAAAHPAGPAIAQSASALTAMLLVFHLAG